MKRPQFDVGFSYAANALARRVEETHVRLAAHGVECASRFEVTRRALSVLVVRGTPVTSGRPTSVALAEPSGTAPTEPAMPSWRGTLAGPSEPPRTSGLVTIAGPLPRGRR